MTEIGQNAFDGFTALETVTLPDGLTKIGGSAFTNTAYYADDANWENGALYIGQYLVDADNVSGAFTAREGTVLIADYAPHVGERDDVLLRTRGAAFYRRGCVQELQSDGDPVPSRERGGHLRRKLYSK